MSVCPGLSLNVDCASRREILRAFGGVGISSSCLPILLPQSAGAAEQGAAFTLKGTADSMMNSDSALPRDFLKSYIQYRTTLQLASDYFNWDLRDAAYDNERWGELSAALTSQSARAGQGQPSKIERDFTNPMRM